ncbi:MAG: patatin-like phospholipase family protein [Hyphomicrobium zavarzinii]|jgi:NTE family protein|uniref:patatin-like phospholipase family protein n=1 Tax=Hyphomicrobium TaxID=81 RepID=UPI00036AD6A4|nr:MULTISPECIES: patatin-like phospholipase family protein [Hyphomicrobium]MBL8846373.1 patatin-like phospholipase family protein [Hyphomicrobium zavarzinii]WBT36632.1 patatin-like phospholipase family protein [Hyphomicrobium sp. DMF-1]HML44116.1 patatin-like phospholipase family protein [Hyphomicrobium zavarzinii]
MATAGAGKLKIGLALGGGAARGWAHIGVLRALRKAGIVPDIIAGTSIGAVVGACDVTGHLDELENFARELTTRRRVLGYLDFNLSGTGLITGHRLGERLHKHLGDIKIEDLPRRFTAVATEIGTGHEVWLSRGTLVDAVRASYALPGVFRPVKVDGRWLFDGALVNPIPVSVCRALGARYVIAVNLNIDISNRGTISNVNQMPGTDLEMEETPPVTGSNGIAVRRLLQRQILGKGDDVPGISTVMVDAFNIVQDRIARSRLAGDPPDAMISPRLHGIGLFDFHRADELIARGEAAAKREVDDLSRELDTRHIPHGQAQLPMS